MFVPWYVHNCDSHWDIKIPMLAEEIKKFAGKHEVRFHQYFTPKGLQLLDNQNLVQKMKRTKPCDFNIYTRRSAFAHLVCSNAHRSIKLVRFKIYCIKINCWSENRDICINIRFWGKKNYILA